MAKDTIAIGVSNVARLVDAGWIGVNNVAREIEEVWIGDTSGKAQLVWKAGFEKVKALFNGYTAVANAFGQYTSTISESSRYDSDADKAYSLAQNIECISMDGTCFVTGGSTSYSIYYIDGTSFKRNSYIEQWSTDNIRSVSAYSIDTNATARYVIFSLDGNRLCYNVAYTTSSSSKYSIGLVFLKKNSSGGFEYETDVCLLSNITYSGSTVSNMQISDDLTTVSFGYYPTVNASTIYKIFKGSPDTGYKEIYSGSKELYLDEEFGEYAVTSAGVLLQIGSTSCTEITQFSHRATDLRFNYERSVMYISYAGTLYSYKVTSGTVTLLGSYNYKTSQYSKVFLLDENAEGKALILAPYGTTASGDMGSAIFYVTLSKNANGCITGYTEIYRIFSTLVDMPKRRTTRFYSTEV